MVSNTSTNKAPQKKAAPATAKRGGKPVTAATVDDAAKRAAKKKADDVVQKAVQKKADDVAKKAAPKKAHDVAQKAAQKKADGAVKKAAVAAKKRVGKPMVAAASFKAAATVDDMAKKAAAIAVKRVGKAVAAAASFKAAATVFHVADGGYTFQIPDQTSTGVHFCHPLSRDIPPAKENMRKKEENTERPGLVQCKYYPNSGDSISGRACKYNNHRRGEIPVAPITESNFLGLPIRPGKKDCSYYMLKGFCKYESNCRFNHPDPTPMEGVDVPSVCGNGGSGPSQGAFQPTVFSSSPPPRTVNETVPFVPVVFSPTQKVPQSNVEWNGYQNTTIVETAQPHSLLTTVLVAPSPLASPTTNPALPTTIDGRLPVSPTTADGKPLTSPILMEEDPKLVKAARYEMLSHKMVKLCARSCELKVAYEFVDAMVAYMCAEVDKMFLEAGDSIDEGNKRLEVVDPKFLQVNGLKKRVNLRKVKRRLRKKVTISKPTRLGQATGV